MIVAALVRIDPRYQKPTSKKRRDLDIARPELLAEASTNKAAKPKCQFARFDPLDDGLVDLGAASRIAFRRPQAQSIGDVWRTLVLTATVAATPTDALNPTLAELQNRGSAFCDVDRRIVSVASRHS